MTMERDDMATGRSRRWGTSLSRRELLVLTAGTVVMVPSALGSCTVPPAPSPSLGSPPHGHPATGASPLQDLLAARPFFIAHRGSGDNWPEHTAYAYAQAAALGAKAIEVSLSSTLDGVLVCHHLLNTEKLTGRNWNIPEHSYAELAALRNDAREWLGPASPLESIPRVKDVLDVHAAERVVFIEDKQGTNTAAVLELLDSYPHAEEHFVWKQPGSVAVPEAVRERGYKSWGYFTDGSGRQFEKYAGQFDLLGIHHDASDEEISRLVAYGKPVVCWEVHTRWMRARLEGLGVRGMMCSNLPYVGTGRAASRRDSFASGLRAAGDLPWIHTWDSQPVLQPGTASLRFQGPGRRSYVMGSMCPVEDAAYALDFEMRLPGAPGGQAPTQWEAGIAFGQSSDMPFRPWIENPLGGYFLSLNAQGELGLFRQEAGPGDPVPLASVATPSPVPDRWMKFRVEVSPTAIEVSRLDGQELKAETADAGHRGGYFSLYKSHDAALAADFRGLSLTPRQA